MPLAAPREREREREIEFLSKFNHSKNGKTPIDNSLLNKLDDLSLHALYNSYLKMNNLGSILNISANKLIDSIANKRVDLITYSFPCQDLSVAGSFWGFNKGMAKELKNRSGLLWEIVRIIQELNQMKKLPKFLLLENVKNMISKRHINEYKKLLEILASLGYSTKTFVLNAKDYNLPQNRERVYAISILNYQGSKNKFGEILDIENPKPITKKKNLKSIIKQDYTNQKYYLEALEAQPNRTLSRKKMFDLNRKLNDYKNVFYSRTVTTKQDRHPNAGIIDLKNTLIGDSYRAKNKANYRFITPREAYLLMGFDEIDFEKVQKTNLIRKEKLYQQAGNSIAVDVMIPIMKLIQENNNE